MCIHCHSIFVCIFFSFCSCRFIEPTILLDPPLDAEIMTEEIFGPLLPIITVRNLDFISFLFHVRQFRPYHLFVQLTNKEESIEFINSRPKPLALYAFTKDEAFKRRILSETSSGSVTFNDIMIQVLHTIPFFLCRLLSKEIWKT